MFEAPRCEFLVFYIEMAKNGLTGIAAALYLTVSKKTCHRALDSFKSDKQHLHSLRAALPHKKI